MKFVNAICGVLLLAVSSAQPPIPSGCLPAHGTQCTKVSGAGFIAQGKWTQCPGEPDQYCRNDKKFQVLQNQYRLTHTETVNTIYGYCSNPNPQSIFECTENYWNGNKHKPSAFFDYCCETPTRRRLSTGAACWPAGDPRVVGFVDVFILVVTWNLDLLFVEFIADQDAGCSEGRPIYKTLISEYEDQLTLKRTNGKWEMTLAGSSSYARCDKYNLQDCTGSFNTWETPGIDPVVSAIVYDEYMACQYLETTRDVELHSSWLAGIARYPDPLPMEIQYEDRCFFGRPAWAGTTAGAWAAANQAMPSYARKYIFYLSYEHQAGKKRWVVTFDYIDYNYPVYECFSNHGDLVACTDPGDFLWVFDLTLHPLEVQQAQLDYPMDLVVTSNGTSLGRTNPPPVRLTPPSEPSINLFIASCTFLNFAAFTAHCVYKRQSTPAKIIDASAL